MTMLLCFCLLPVMCLYNFYLCNAAPLEFGGCGGWRLFSVSAILLPTVSWYFWEGGSRLEGRYRAVHS
jgi:hypothetical protein